MDEIELEGYFWADDQSPRIRGGLRLGAQRGTLGLEAPLRLIESASTDRIDVIRGRSLLGEPVCLLDAFVSRLGTGEPHVQVWTINGALIGTDEPEPAVTGLRTWIEDLDLFYGTPYVHVESHDEGDQTLLNIRWTSRSEVTVSLPDGLRILFDHDYSVTGTGSRLQLIAPARVQVVADTPCAIEALQKAIGPMLVLVAICVGRPVEVLQQRVVLHDGSEARYWIGNRALLREASDPRPWIGLGNLEPIEERLSKWFALYDEMPSAFAMLAEYGRSGPATPWEDRLLYLARFFEQYHRARYTGRRLPRDEFKERRRQVKDALPEDLGQWVDSILQGGNERRLAERLQELVEDLGESVCEVIADPQAFSKAVTDTRNYYTHYSERKGAQVARQLDLVVMVRTLWIVARACVLRELGLPVREVRDLMRLDRHHSWLVARSRSGPDPSVDDSSG